MRRALAAGLLVASLTAAPAMASPPQAPFDDSTWRWGNTGFNSKLYCSGFCLSYFVMQGRVAVRGPEGDVHRSPMVGERFYIRTQVSLLSTPWSVTDTYRTRVILPTGLAPAITAGDDVICAVTTTDNVTVRVPGPAECQDPAQSGVEWVFPPVALDESITGQMAQFWFPVVATQPLSGATVQMLGQAVNNPLAVLPNPVVSNVAVTVDPAPTPAPATAPAPSDTSGTSSGGGATGSATTSTPLAGVVGSSAAGAVVVAWRPPTATGVTGYRVQARIAGTRRWRAVGTAPRTARTFRWKRARRGTTYYLRVAPLYGTRLGAWSRAVRVRAR